MKGDPLPDEDHIARLCGGARLDEDGKVIGACFMPRSNEAYLSVNWLEWLAPTGRMAQLTGVRQAEGQGYDARCQRQAGRAGRW